MRRSYVEHTLNKKFWIGLFAGLFGYYLAFQIHYAIFSSKSTFEETHGVEYPFHPPTLIGIVVFATAFFYLYNLGIRFRELNELWARLSRELTDPTDDWTDSELAVFAECARLLHAKLCELLRLFSWAYGPVLLTYFATTFILNEIDLFIMLVFNGTDINMIVMASVFYTQYLAFTTTILYVATWVIDEKKIIISYLRMMKISEMPAESKLQVKMFMGQISQNESSELTAFGFFNINLKTTMSILVLIITSAITLVQMKKHPVMVYFNDKILSSSQPNSD